ncbi:MAG: S-methyl-5-thioribose-1-phosphate isomerase [Candidatus Heimdallarchaeaceae archaeon]
MKIKSLNLDDVKSVEWISENKSLKLLDQRLLPWKVRFTEYKTVESLCSAIKDMVVRGAPAIGVTAAYTMVLAVLEVKELEGNQRKRAFDKRYRQLVSTRPTAVDLQNYAEQIYNIALSSDFSVEETLYKAHELTEIVLEECKLIAEYGEKIIQEGDALLTHCHAGAAATVDYGTALAPIHLAHKKGKKIRVYVDETRPRLQGAKITAWELEEAGIEHAIISDNSAALLMSKGMIDKIIVGADRCLTDGTITNKIGTLSLAISAKFFNVPFYVAFPWSTVDFETENREGIRIEERDTNEVKYVEGEGGKILIANKNSKALNYAFDITPAELIEGYITPAGILNLTQLKEKIKEISNKKEKRN